MYRINSKSTGKFKTKLREQLEEMEQGEGLATLMPDIQDTANLVSTVTAGLVDFDHDSDGESSMDRLMFASLEEKYLKLMKSLQFGECEFDGQMTLLTFVIFRFLRNDNGSARGRYQIRGVAPFREQCEIDGRTIASDACQKDSTRGCDLIDELTSKL